MNALIEPFFICLLVSMIWAPIVFFGAQRFGRKDKHADKVWPAALAVAALPAFIAPIAAALGLSFRAAPAPLPPMAEPQMTSIPFPITSETVAPTPVSSITIASLFEAAAALYLYGFMMFLALGVIRHIWFAYRVRYAAQMDEPRLQAAFETWRQRLGVRRKPRYAFTDVVSSVCVHGIFRPVVLMPEALLDKVKEDDVVLMVAHEMAHIKRGDTALFAFCTIVKAVFWFNPFMQRIAALANLAAEQSADALVIAKGAERRRYAQCFVQGLRFAAGSQFAGRDLVPSFTPFDRRSRRERLDAILSGKHDSTLDLRAKAGLVLSIIGAGALAFAQAAFAVAPTPAGDALTHTPVEGKVTAVFTHRNIDLDSKKTPHQGVDIKAPRGAAVHAAGDGKVIDATSRYRDQPAWGKVVVIDHGHGLLTRYAHLDHYSVRKGDSVKAGAKIGAVGSTGRSTKPHLHFEVIRDGHPIDPMPVIAAEPMPAPKPVISPEPVFNPSAEPEPEPAAPPAPPAPPAPKKYALAGGGNKILNFTLPTAVKPETPPSHPYAELAENMVYSLEAQLSDALTTIEAAGIEAAGDLEFGLSNIKYGIADLDSLPDISAVKSGIEQSLNDIEFFSEEELENLSEFHIHIAEAAHAAASEIHIDAKRIHEDADQARKAAKQARKEAERARKNAERARKQAERDREQAQRDQEMAMRAKEQAQREHEMAMRAEEQAERERERAREQAERTRARAERDAERAQKQAARAAERALRDAERIRERAERDAEKQLATSQHSMLVQREKAIREAQRDLDRELAEIKRLRAELAREEK